MCQKLLIVRKKTSSYWSHALELCDLNSPLEKLKSKYICIGHYWRKVGKTFKDDVTFESFQVTFKLLLSMSLENCHRELFCDKQVSSTATLTFHLRKSD